MPTWYHSAPTDSPFTTVSFAQWSAGNIEVTGNPEFLRDSNSFTTASVTSPLPAHPPSPFSHKSLHRPSEDQSSCFSQINKMNFKFLLAGNMAGFFFIKSQLMLLHFSVCGCCGPDAHCPLQQRQDTTALTSTRYRYQVLVIENVPCLTTKSSLWSDLSM